MMKKKIVVTAVAGALMVGLTGMADAAKSPKKEYVGSESCKKCHKIEYKSWKESYHAKMVRSKKDGILKEVVQKWATDGTTAGPTKGNVTGKEYKLDDVVYVVGSIWKQRYLVKDEETGGLQFLNMQYNRSTGLWEKYGNKNDWNTNCATCHTTGYRITLYDEKAGKTVKSEYAELNIGCESCHGPGAAHVKSKKKKDIINIAAMSAKEQSKVCGYCHIRVENEKFKTAQGHPREDLPAPKVGQSYKPGDDWTAWYPEEVVIPGVHANRPFNAEYKGDVKGLFKLDDHAKQTGVFEEAKHHQQYQGYLQSAHYLKADLSCLGCHSAHAGKGKLQKVAKDTCKACHDESYTMEKYMPATGKTADKLFVRSHTFNKTPRQGGASRSEMQEPVYNKK